MPGSFGRVAISRECPDELDPSFVFGKVLVKLHCDCMRNDQGNLNRMWFWEECIFLSDEEGEQQVQNHICPT